MNDQPISLHPLWAQEYWMLVAMFEDDPDVSIESVDSDKHSCKISFSSPRKAEIFNKYINTAELEIEVVTSDSPKSSEEELAELFSSNPHFSKLYVSSSTPFPFKALLFKPECMNYFSDDMFSPTGHTAITARDLAKILFGGSRTNFQTDLMY